MRHGIVALLIVMSPGAALGQGAPSIAGCPVFPSDNIWNRAVDKLPKAPFSDAQLALMEPTWPVYPDLGTGVHRQGITRGIPFIVVPGTQAKFKVDFEYAPESDPGPYPISPEAPIEGGSASDGDRHVLMIDKDNCRLYELFSVRQQPNGKWKAGSGAVFDLRSDKLRPYGWTSGDAAGLPIFPGLIRFDEVMSGEIQHAIRFTIENSRDNFVWPGRHSAGNSDNPKSPPMGLRLRLKADFPIEGFSPEVSVILKALKKYGMILADNGPNWDLTGTPDERWNNEHLKELARVHGGDFEIVDTEPLRLKEDSAQAKP